MNNLQIFNSDEFGKIRTAIVNSEPMFCLSDVWSLTIKLKAGDEQLEK